MNNMDGLTELIRVKETPRRGPDIYISPKIGQRYQTAKTFWQNHRMIKNGYKNNFHIPNKMIQKGSRLN